MRFIEDPGEAGSLALSGWIVHSSAQTWDTGAPHKITKGGVEYGGTYVLKNSSSGTNRGIKSPTKTNGAKEYYGKIFWKMGQTDSDLQWRFADGAGTTTMNVQVSNGGEILVIDQTGTILSTGFLPTSSCWYLLELHVIMDGTSGIMEFKIDGVVIGTVSGAISVGDGSGMKSMHLTGADTTYIDDAGCNVITMRYDGGTAGSAPAAGETLTGGTSGATLVVTHLLSGNATAGTVMGHLWDGTAFQDNEAVTSSGTLVAVINAPTGFTNGFEPNSGWLGNTLVARFDPTADGNTSGLTNSAGDSINNWSYVDDLGGADFVKATAANQRDTYVMSVSAGLPAAASCTVAHVSAYTYAESVLAGVDGVSLVLRYSGTDYDSTRNALTSAYLPYSASYDTRPDGDAVWDHAAAVAIENGQVFVA